MSEPPRPSGAPEVLCFGETMVLLAPGPQQRLGTARRLAVRVAGAESTVAQYVADLGHRAAWASRVGVDPFGDQVLAEVARPGVDVSAVERDAEAPTGVYFKDPDPDGTRVHYYRAGSAASRTTPAYVDALPLEHAQVVHLSGITPALSDSCAAAVDALLDRAGRAGVLRSFDVNHRPALWRGGRAAEVLLSLARRADLVFGGLDEARRLWGTTRPREVRDLLGEVELVVKDAEVGATVFRTGGDPGEFAPALPVEVVEPVGAGDAFAAGYLSARLHDDPPVERLRLGHRLAALALGSVADHAGATELRREGSGR